MFIRIGDAISGMLRSYFRHVWGQDDADYDAAVDDKRKVSIGEAMIGIGIVLAYVTFMLFNLAARQHISLWPP